MKKEKRDIQLPEGFTYNPELDKYSGQILFPKKFAEIKRMLEECPFPQELIDMMDREDKK